MYVATDPELRDLVLWNPTRVYYISNLLSPYYCNYTIYCTLKTCPSPPKLDSTVWLNERSHLTCWHSVGWSTSRWYPSPHPRRRSPSSSWLGHTRPIHTRRRERGEGERGRRGGRWSRGGEEKGRRKGRSKARSVVPTMLHTKMFPFVSFPLRIYLLCPPISESTC